MKKMFTLIVSTLVLTACGSAPKDVANDYWQGIINQDRNAVTAASSSRSTQELWRMVTPEKGSTASFGETDIKDDDTATVETQLQWLEADLDEPVNLELFTMLVKEDDQWKVNTASTRQQFYTAIYRNSLKGLSATLAESLASFQALGEEAAADFTDELDRTIEELQQQSNQANKDIQNFLENLDKDLKKTIESIDDDK